MGRLARSWQREGLEDIRAYLHDMARVAERLYGLGLGYAEGLACEVEAASRAKFWTNSILSVLAGATELHAAAVLGLNRWLESLLAKIIRDVRGEGGAVFTGAVSNLRVDVLRLKEKAAFEYRTSRWLERPVAVVAGLVARVWITHGRYTENFNRELWSFEIRHAEIIHKFQAKLKRSLWS